MAAHAIIDDLAEFHYWQGQRDPDARYPESQRVTLEEGKDWSELVRTLRTCMYCRKVFRHNGAAITCEHNHRRGGNAAPGAPL